MPLNPSYERILKQAGALKKENKAFLDKLKKSRPADLDIVTNKCHDEAFEQIDCLKCANCCSTTGPLIRNKDITLLAKHFRQREALFTSQYLRIDEDGDYIFKSMPCPFLKDDNHCSVYSSRPGACRDYPHTSQRNIAEKIPVTFLNSMICPAVAVVIDKLKTHYSVK
jgi:Fe-S-cluster containining protein